MATPPPPPTADDAPPSLQIPTPTSNLPPYPEMIMAAIEALNESEGSSKTEISKQIELTYPDLPATHATLITHHLNTMKQTAQLTLVKNNYMKPDPNAPPKRGRGRPPKPKDPTPTGTVVSSPRPRGRPPKSKDPFAAAVAADTAPEVSPSKKNPAPSGRPRGRPPKKARTEEDEAPPAADDPALVAPAAQASVPAGGAPRGRGRPPKVKPAVAPVAG